MIEDIFEETHLAPALLSELTTEYLAGCPRGRINKSVLNSFADYCSEHDFGFTPESSAAFLDCLAAGGMKPGSVAAYASAMRQFCSWLKQRGHIKKNPFTRIHAHLAKSPDVFLFLTPVEVDELKNSFAAAGPSDVRDMLAIYLILDMHFTGRELLRLKRGHLVSNRKSGTMAIRDFSGRAMQMPPRAAELCSLPESTGAATRAGDDLPLLQGYSNKRPGAALSERGLRDALHRRLQAAFPLKSEEYHRPTTLYNTSLLIEIGGGATRKQIAARHGIKLPTTLDKYFALAEKFMT